MLVVAGAGTGKTLTLAARVAWLVKQGVDPQRLLLLTFSRRAAAEMARRAGQLLHSALGLPRSTAAPSLPWCGTKRPGALACPMVSPCWIGPMRKT